MVGGVRAVLTRRKVVVTALPAQLGWFKGLHMTEGRETRGGAANGWITREGSQLGAIRRVSSRWEPGALSSIVKIFNS